MDRLAVKQHYGGALPASVVQVEAPLHLESYANGILRSLGSQGEATATG